MTGKTAVRERWRCLVSDVVMAEDDDGGGDNISVLFYFLLLSFALTRPFRLEDFGDVLLVVC